MRLHNQHDKLDESNDSLVDYMWNEYELTYSYALELKSDELTNLNDLRKQINILKASIKKLGDVNVNAIEEYKEVSERYTFLKTQHDDMIEAEQSLMKVITELDNGMRTQFTAKFEEDKKWNLIRYSRNYSAVDVVQLNLWKMKIYLKRAL